MKQFTFSDIWNQSVETQDREMKERDYCWASELGKPLADRYLAMKATPPTNPPNIRSRRKFFAGNVWEFIAGLVLYQLGIIQEGQEHVEVEEYALKVTGRLDFKIGGTPDYKKAREAISLYPFDDAIANRFMKAIDNFEKNFGTQEIMSLVYEIKSCSEYVLEKIEGGGCIPWHDQQLWHYLKGLNMERGQIAYISKNDALMCERTILLSDKGIESAYKEGLEKLKGFLDTNERPPTEPLITFDGKFQKNFGIEYSQYLKLLYGFDRPDEYANAVTPKIASWNRVLTRMKAIEDGETTPTGKAIELTDKNKEAIEEMNKEGFDPNKLVKLMDVKSEE